QPAPIYTACEHTLRLGADGAQRLAAGIADDVGIPVRPVSAHSRARHRRGPRRRAESLGAGMGGALSGRAVAARISGGLGGIRARARLGLAAAPRVSDEGADRSRVLSKIGR